MNKNSLRGLRALVMARLREFRREPSAFFFVLFMPVLWMMFLGPAFSDKSPEIFNVGLETQEPISEELLQVKESLRGASSIKLIENKYDKLRSSLRRSDIQLIMHLSQNNVSIEYDPSNRDAQRARDHLYHLIQNAGGRKDIFKIQDISSKVPGSRYVDFLIPGLLGVSILSTSMWGVGMTIVSHRKENLLKRLLATPLHSYNYILSHIIGRSIILLVEVGTQLLAAGFLFRFFLQGSLINYFIFSLFGAATLTALAIFVGSRMSNTGAMNGVANLISLPMMLVSGAWFNRSYLPDWMGTIAKFLPLTMVVDGLRKIALEAASLQDLGWEISLLTSYFVVFSIAASRLFKWHS